MKKRLISALLGVPMLLLFLVSCGGGAYTEEEIRAALEELEANTSCTYDKLYIVGGGAKNQFLNRLTA